MKRILVVGLVALGLAATSAPLRADCMFEYSCCRHLCYVGTSKSRCFNYSSHANPLPCGPGGHAGPALWDGLAAYGAPPYPYAAPVAAAPAAAAAATPAAPAAPAATTPSFKAPQPSPATKSSAGVQQAGYFYYGPTSNAGYSANAGYNYGTGYGYGAGYGYYGYGYGASYAQAPNYWY
jgi:hypothetical protein